MFLQDMKELLILKNNLLNIHQLPEENAMLIGDLKKCPLHEFAPSAAFSYVSTAIDLLLITTYLFFSLALR